VERVATALSVPVADVYGVTEFYEMLYTHPVGGKVFRVCQDAPCALAGADAAMTNLCEWLRIRPGETTPDGHVTVEPVRCLGLCDRAPAALINLDRYAPLDSARPEIALNGVPSEEPLAIGGLVKLALSNVGVVDPTRLQDYASQGGLAALRQALLNMTPGRVLEEVKVSKLVGRGGAAFPTGLKWEFAARNPGPRYVICNADESEPGAFKDRVLMDGDPFRVVEGLTLACYAVGAEKGFIYVRGEHRQGYDRFSGAVRQLKASGYLGENILGTGFKCDCASSFPFADDEGRSAQLVSRRVNPLISQQQHGAGAFNGFLCSYDAFLKSFLLIDKSGYQFRRIYLTSGHFSEVGGFSLE